jgi:peptidoglycan/LPS O-acetylase OafA/YrhL
MQRPGDLSPPAHIAALDGLRGIAILLVIPHNANIFSHAAPWLWPFALVADAGWIGVQLFFVLSGFLITRNLLESRDADNYFSAFYGRRVLRIFPLYYLTLIVALLIVPRFFRLDAGAIASYDNQIWLWTFLSNWAQPLGHDVSGFSHFWSLAIEEQFYALWPLVVLALSSVRLFWACIGLVAVALISRSVLLYEGAKPEMVYMFTVCRMDALAIGAAAAILAQSDKCIEWIRRNYKPSLIVGALVLAILAASSETYAVYDAVTLTVGYPILSIVFAMLVLTMIALSARQPAHWMTRLLSTRWLRSVGRYSFAMYVFHMPVIIIAGDWIRSTFAASGTALPLVYAVAATVLSYVAGFASYHLLEKHFLRLKSAFAPRPRAALESTQP